MFQVSQQIDFCYGHRLLNYAGKCRFLHGHNGRAVVTLAGPKVDDRGMLVDFADIKRSLKDWIDHELDHRMILAHDDPLVDVLRQHEQPLYVVRWNPTAENIARLICEQALALDFPVKEVALWETPNSCAVYRPDSA